MPSHRSFKKLDFRFSDVAGEGSVPGSGGCKFVWHQEICFFGSTNRNQGCFQSFGMIFESVVMNLDEECS